MKRIFLCGAAMLALTVAGAQAQEPLTKEPPTRKAIDQFKSYGVTPVFEVYPSDHQPKAFRPVFASFVSKQFT